MIGTDVVFTYQHNDRPVEGYTIQRGVGRGGFGEVYYAVSDGGKEVAVKYLRDNPQVELRGIEHCMNLKSPHLVTIYDVRQDANGQYYVVMEYVSGPSLRDLLIAEDKGLGPQKAAFFLREIAKGLGYLHDRGIVHRDLKPGNIFYEDGYVKIGDYGLSKFISVSHHSVQTTSVGTVHYMAPEVGSGNYHRGIDIYALGVILYEMLCGKVPFEGSSMGEVLMKHLTAQPEVDELPAPFGEVIRKALAKDPADRYQTVDEMTSAVFGEADIAHSVARFEPTSITAAAARVHIANRKPPVVGAVGTGSSRVEPLGGQSAPADYSTRPGLSDKPPDSDWTDPVRNNLDWVEARLHRLEGARRYGPPVFPPRSRWVAGVLGLTLGPLGAHRFYLGFVRVGVAQLLVTVFTGIGALWGFLEGIMILCGWGTDVYGRPLRSGPDPDARFVGFRILWGLLAVAAVAFAIIMGLLPAFVVENERFYDAAGNEYLVNVARFFYAGALSAAGLGVFAVWKAGHGPYLTFWRSTIRPAVMWLCWCLLAWAAAMDALLRLGEGRVVIFATAAVAVIGWLLAWIMRGQDRFVHPSKVSGQRHLSAVMFVVALCCVGIAALLADLAGQWPFEGHTLFELTRYTGHTANVLTALAVLALFGAACCAIESAAALQRMFLFQRRLAREQGTRSEPSKAGA